MNSGTSASRAAGITGWLVALWIVQILLGLFYGYAGFMKLTMTPEAMAGMGLAYATTVPRWLLYFIGASELAGAVGLVLLPLLRMAPLLTLAAAGLSAIQLLAIPFHLMRGEAMVVPMNLTLLAMSLFVIWGRTRKVR